MNSYTLYYNMYLHFVINNCTHKLNNVTLTVKCRSPRRKKSSVPCLTVSLNTFPSRLND
jgi:hypothetical protein